MRKKLTEQDECYTPKKLVNYFGRFDYDPATTEEQAEYLKIKNYDTVKTNGLISKWGYPKIWINPPFTQKFEFLEKAVNTYKENQNDIYILFPIESLTTKRAYDILKDIKFKMYIPNYRIGFIINGKEYKTGAFGIVVLNFRETFGIELITKDMINKGEENE